MYVYIYICFLIFICYIYIHKGSSSGTRTPSEVMNLQTTETTKNSFPLLSTRPIKVRARSSWINPDPAGHCGCLLRVISTFYSPHSPHPRSSFCGPGLSLWQIPPPTSWSGLSCGRACLRTAHSLLNILGPITHCGISTYSSFSSSASTFKESPTTSRTCTTQGTLF